MEFVRALGVAIRSEVAVVVALQGRFSQQDLATATGMTVKEVRRIERGDPTTSYGQVEAIAAALGMTLLDLHARAEQIMDRTAGSYVQANSGGSNAIIAGQSTIEGYIHVEADKDKDVEEGTS